VKQIYLNLFTRYTSKIFRHFHNIQASFIFLNGNINVLGFIIFLLACVLIKEILPFNLNFFEEE
jgi:hypothetical protein